MSTPIIQLNHQPFEFITPTQKDPSLLEISDVLDQIRGQYADSVVHGIEVNQIPIDLEDLSSAELFPLAEVKTLSVQVRSARSTALETLDTLGDFLDQLSQISKEIRSSEDLVRLVGGLTTTVDSLQECRRILGAPSPEAQRTLQHLERDLVEIMAELSELIEAKKDLERHPLLQVSLPRHLDQWRSQGISALIT